MAPVLQGGAQDTVWGFLAVASYHTLSPRQIRMHDISETSLEDGKKDVKTLSGIWCMVIWKLDTWREG
jgi:hypothetical protein